MDIRGLAKLTLLDYPGHIACTVFTGGCSFKCPFCHNGGLVLTPNDNPLISEEEFFEFLKARQGKLEGVCITGGEPTLRFGLSDFITHIKELGFKVKLDTNGYHPDVLNKLLLSGKIDMIAMDIKNSPEKYALTVGLSPDDFDLGRIKESISLIKDSNIDHEFRTTLVREFHTREDLVAIGEWLAGPSRFFLQNYKESDDIIFKMTKSSPVLTSFSEIEMMKFLSVVRAYLPNSHIRGIED